MHSGPNFKIRPINSKFLVIRHIFPNSVQGEGQIRRGIRIWRENLKKFWPLGLNRPFLCWPLILKYTSGPFFGKKSINGNFLPKNDFSPFLQMREFFILERKLAGLSIISKNLIFNRYYKLKLKLFHLRINYLAIKKKLKISQLLSLKCYFKMNIRGTLGSYFWFFEKRNNVGISILMNFLLFLLYAFFAVILSFSFPLR